MAGSGRDLAIGHSSSRMRGTNDDQTRSRTHSSNSDRKGIEMKTPPYAVSTDLRAVHEFSDGPVTFASRSTFPTESTTKTGAGLPGSYCDFPGTDYKGRLLGAGPSLVVASM